MSLVGIIANPASGKDIRRLTAHGSVFDNQEKVRIVRRMMMGMMAVGVERVIYMPDYYGIVRRAMEGIKVDIPAFPANFKPSATHEDSVRAASIMARRQAGCIVTLGGDGTNRAVAKGGARVPILPVSTGTNNVFPYMVEATLAGLAAGLVASGRVSKKNSVFTTTKLDVIVDGITADSSLVDVAVYDDPFIGSRAVWEMGKVRQIFLNRAEPDSIGLSSIGGLIHPVKAHQPEGLRLDMGTGGQIVTAPVAPGMIVPVAVRGCRVMRLGDMETVRFKPSVLALDGERELEIKADQDVVVRLAKNGPLVVDVSRVMAEAMEKAELTEKQTAWPEGKDLNENPGI